MKTKDFIKLIVSSNAVGGDVLEIFYDNGEVVEGWVQKIDPNYDPPFVNLCKNSVARNQSSDHTIKFDKIIKVVVKKLKQDPITHQRD
ncbi:MAG: hypothetical protein O9302_08295 [Cyclobacteriaceae bacterium]|jgi:hypothetical protein|nr:hypothetical protein [Cytophagales bacterium]MCZ8328045.1 hypothetical protein [Cyclobacteriaceae bacterium]